MNSQEKYALVFGGGGSRGAFEVGVLNAIRELNIPIGLIVGSSIGSLNATFAVQGADLADLYNRITLQNIIPDENLNSEKDIFEFENLMQTVKGVIKNKGYSTENLHSLIEEYIDFEKIYESEIDLGIVTCSTPFTPLVAFKNGIPKEQLIDYIIASCCFPIFKRQTIDGKKYIDGGFWDNVPVNVAISRGYTKIIAVDLSSVGFRKPTKKVEGLEITIIKAPKKSIGGLFEMNSEQINFNIKLGYETAMNIFK